MRKYNQTTGKVKLYHGETIPTGTYPEKGKDGYVPSIKVLKITRRSMGFHPNLQFLRAGAVIWALKKLRELGLSPIRIKRDTLPERIRDQGYDNYMKVLNTFHACYCYAQGHSRTSDIARLVLIYLHLGKGVFKNKTSNIIPILHKKVQTGLHRFTSQDKIEKYWVEFLDLVENADEEDLDIFLDDKGAGSVSQKYMIAVETGLRAWAADKCAMGVHAFDSEENYHAIEVWKKREAYIAVCRYLRGIVHGYLKYINYAWYDYKMRTAMQKTFDERHAPYTNGTKKLAGLADPEEWKEQPVQKKRVSRQQREHNPTPTVATLSNDAEYLYDSEEDEWVKVGSS